MERANNTPMPPLSSMTARERNLRLADHIMRNLDPKVDQQRQRAADRRQLTDLGNRVALKERRHG